MFNKLLSKFESKGIRIVAFADDVVIIVSGKSKRQLEERGQVALEIAQFNQDSLLFVA